MAEHFSETDGRFANPSTGFDRDRLLMQIYWEPLQAYYNGSTFRRRDVDSADAVSGFLTWYTERRYLERWEPGRQRLRYFLLNGFQKYLKERWRIDQREGQVRPLPEGLAGEASPAPEFDRQYVRLIVRRALERGEQACQPGLAQHWQMFYRHTIDGEAYAQIASSFGVRPARAEGMARAGRRRFREAFLALLREQGLRGEELMEETHLYQEILEG